LNYNPNQDKLKNKIFDKVKEITLKGGMTLYNEILNDIEKCIIKDEEDLNRVLEKNKI
jgi:hypothetical protein